MLVAITCGIFGALASISGKFALSSSDFDVLLISSLPFLSRFCPDQETGICSAVYWLVRALVFVTMLVCNALMIANFLSALESSSSLIVTVTSSAVNFLSTGILGKLLFHEEVNVRWYIGSFWIILGLLLITYSQGVKKKISQ